MLPLELPASCRIARSHRRLRASGTVVVQDLTPRTVLAGAQPLFAEKHERHPALDPYAPTEETEQPSMSAGARTTESPAVRPTRDPLVPIGFGITTAVGAITTLLSAATVWLVLTRPLEVAGALGERQGAEVVLALAGLVLSALRDLLRYL